MFSQIRLILGTITMLFVFKQHMEITPHTTTSYCLVVKKHDITLTITCITECLQVPVMKLLYQDKTAIPVAGSL